jgi:hypothetical protein
MSRANRATKSFSIDRELHRYVVRTRGAASASERVNQLLRRAIEVEQQVELDREAARFFAAVRGEDRKGIRSFQKAAKRSIRRG